MTPKFKITDISYDFLNHPVTGNLVLAKNDQVIKQSIKTLLFLNIFDKPYVSGIDVGLKNYLFENINIIDGSIIRSKIELILANFEPRIEVNSVDFLVLEKQNSFQINIEYTIIGQEDVYDSVSFIFGRNR